MIRFYKVIVDNQIVGIGTSASLRKYQKKHKVIISSDEDFANYLQYKDTLYHDIWMLDDNHADYILAEIIEIKQGEYKSLEITLEENESVDVEEAEQEEVIPDISSEENEDIDFAKSRKIAELSRNCNVIIENGFDIVLSDKKEHHFSLTTNDQLNLITLSSMIASGEKYIPYHADGELCVFYSVEDAEDIVETATQLKMYHTTYFNSLKAYVNSMETINEIERVNYGITIPEEFESEVLRNLYSV